MSNARAPIRLLAVDAAAFTAIAHGQLNYARVPPDARSGDLVWVHPTPGAAAAAAAATNQGVFRELAYVDSGVANLSYPTVRRPAKVVMGVDPGFANTGVVVLAGPHGPEGRAAAAWEVIDVACIRTSKDAQLAKTAGVLADDLRRLDLIRSGLSNRARYYTPDIVSVEAYVVFDDHAAESSNAAARDLTGFMAGIQTEAQLRALAADETGHARRLLEHIDQLGRTIRARSTVRGRGAAAKTLGVYHSTCALAQELGVTLEARYPQQLKRALLGKQSGTKGEIQAGVRRLLGDQLEAAMVARGIPRGAHEHCWDAAGHALASLRAAGAAIESAGAPA
jgi:Holliday junction resolvasome RuvABC endonuclease subunit